ADVRVGRIVFVQSDQELLRERGLRRQAAGGLRGWHGQPERALRGVADVERTRRENGRHGRGVAAAQKGAEASERLPEGEEDVLRPDALQRAEVDRPPDEVRRIGDASSVEEGERIQRRTVGGGGENGEV